MISLLNTDGECYLHEGFLARAAADDFFERIRRRAVWSQPQVRMFGRTVRAPRLAAWHGDAGACYAYSGQSHRPRPWFGALRELRARLEAHCGARFNSVLLNYYRDGDDALGWHSDDEPELAAGAPIASLSLGAARRFVLRHKRRKLTHAVALRHGALLLMCGETQAHWRHALPRTKRPVGARMNLTFRLIRAHSFPSRA
ncbi:MAG: alpha-ketoglutarate-dependent dioxygenase AlkB [Gammaproteobacteria bacterium]